MNDRRPCSCSCSCSCSAAGELCWLCSRGIHAARPELRARLERNLETWAGIVVGLTPDSSSGLSARSMLEAIRQYRAAVDRRPPELGRRPSIPA